MSTDVRARSQSFLSALPTAGPVTPSAGLPATAGSLPQSLLRLAARRLERGDVPPRCAYWIGPFMPPEHSTGYAG